jgi:hypothetical protein
MASGEVCKVRLSEAERDALIAKLDAAAVLLGTDKPLKLVFSNGDGTWDVGCTLEGEDPLLKDILSCFYLNIDLP